MELVDAMLTGGVFLSALMILVWLARLKSQGARAYVMASAFACMGGLILALKQGLSPVLLWSLGVLVFGCLVADFVIKLGRQAKENSR
ncbi:MAG: hypothetical protein K1X67_02945 [Fimbriimonadaceae bacterium]|nr:hypothetical protein [Fimbriimonadaceae bacterium]